MRGCELEEDSIVQKDDSNTGAGLTYSSGVPREDWRAPETCAADLKDVLEALRKAGLEIHGQEDMVFRKQTRI